MAGHWGHELTTMQNLVVLDIVPKKDIILVLGSIPGPEGSMVIIKTSKKYPNDKKEYTIVTKELQEEILKQNEALEDKDALHAANEAAEAVAKKEQEVEEAKKAAEAVARDKQKEAEEKAQAKQASEAKK
jgi:large subunit ribosomal protein L3